MLLTPTNIVLRCFLIRIQGNLLAFAAKNWTMMDRRMHCTATGTETETDEITD